MHLKFQKDGSIGTEWFEERKTRNKYNIRIY